MRNHEDRTVEAQEGIILGKKYVGASSTASFGIIVESSIRVGGKNNAADAVGDDVARVSDDVIKELIVYGVGDLGGSRLLADKGTGANAELFINHTPIVEEVSNDALYEFNTRFIDDRAGVIRGLHMGLGVVLYLTMILGQDLGIDGLDVAILDEDGCDVAVHCEVYLAPGHVKDVSLGEVYDRELVPLQIFYYVSIQ